MPYEKGIFTDLAKFVLKSAAMFGFGSHSKLSEAEQEQAVLTLRQRLSDGTQPVEEQLRQGGEAGLNGLDDVTLRRWLRAEDFDIGKAESRLRSHALWRRDEFPDGKVHESEIEQELASKKVFMQGLDKQGREILVLKTNRHSKSLRDLKQCMRNLCYCLDKAINAADTTRNPDGKIAGIFDLRNLTMDSIDYSALRGVFDMLSAHYPERLGTLWMYESPGIFWALWKMVSPFIDPVTKKKVIFINEGSSGLKELESEIGLDVLPKDFGGHADLVPIQDASPDGKSLGNGATKDATKPASQVGTENGRVMGP